MADNLDNRKRSFADVVSIDAWHDDFDETRSTVDLHADVVFGTARVGGESDSPVRFRLSIKRAEIVVVIPDLEPIGIDRKSVARDSPIIHGQQVEILEEKAQASAKGNVSLGASRAGLTASMSAEASADASVQGTRRLEISSAIELMIITQSQTDEGHYRWLVEPSVGGVLQGRPWNAADQPRLKIIDRRKNRSKGLPPIVRVEVRCRREDLIIDDLQVKDASVWENATSRLGFKNRIAAAESYIRDRLSKEGLEVGNIGDPFGRLTLGSVTAQST